MHSFLTASVMEETWMSRMGSLLLGTGHLSVEGLAPLLHLRLREVLLMGRQGPFLAEGVLDAADPVSPEHVADGHEALGARRQRPLDRGVDVLDVDVEVHGAAAQRLGRAGA